MSRGVSEEDLSSSKLVETEEKLMARVEEQQVRADEKMEQTHGRVKSLLQARSDGGERGSHGAAMERAPQGARSKPRGVLRRKAPTGRRGPHHSRQRVGQWAQPPR